MTPANSHGSSLSLPPGTKVKGTEKNRGGEREATLMVMFFNWVDLWRAVTIILPFTPGGRRNRAGQSGGREAMRGEGGGWI